MTSATKEDILDDQAIETFLAEHDDWTYEGGRLKASYNLQTFEQAIEVINKIAEVASAMDHHPFMTNVYNRLTFSLCTHSLGDVVTKLDVELAKRISEIIKQEWSSTRSFQEIRKSQ